MTGPDHYREAERLLAEARYPEEHAGLLAEGQVHATLALTAATALPYVTEVDHEHRPIVPSEVNKWVRGRPGGPTSATNGRGSGLIPLRGAHDRTAVVPTAPG